MSQLNASDFSDGIPSPIHTPNSNKQNSFPNDNSSILTPLCDDSSSFLQVSSTLEYPSPSITIKNHGENIVSQEQVYSSSPVPALALSKLMKTHQEESTRNVSNNYPNHNTTYQTPNSNRSTQSTLSNGSSSMMMGNSSHRTISPTPNHNNTSSINGFSRLATSTTLDNTNHSTTTNNHYYSLNSSRSNNSSTTGRFLSPQTPRRFNHHYPMYRSTSTPVISPRYGTMASPRVVLNSTHGGMRRMYNNSILENDGNSLSEMVQQSLEEEGTYPPFGFLLDTLCERQFDRVVKGVHSIIDDSEREIEQLRMWIEKNVEEIDYLNQVRDDLMIQYQELSRQLDTDRQIMLSKSKENENLKFELEMKGLELKNAERQLISTRNMNSELNDRTEQLEKELKQKEKQIVTIGGELGQSEENLKSKLVEITSLNKKIEVYSTETSELKIAKEKLEKQIETLKNEVKTLKGNNEGYLTIIDQQNKTINRVSANLKEKQSELEDKDNERQDLYNQMVILKRNHAEKEDLLMDSQNDLSKLKRRFDDQAKEFESYRQEMKQEIGKYHSLVSDHQQSKMNELEKDQILKKHSSLLEQFEALQMKHSSSVSDLHESRRESQEIQRNNESQKKEIEKLSKKVKEQEEEKLQLEERIRWLENNALEQKSNISKLHRENEELESNAYNFKKDIKTKDQLLCDRDIKISQKEKELQQSIDIAKGKDLEIEQSLEKNVALQKQAEQLDTQVKQLTSDISDLNDECEMLRKYISEEKSFILESDPTLKLVLMMKQEGFPIDESYVDKIRGRSIFNLLRMGVGAYNVRVVGDDGILDSERRREENFFAEKALSKWLQNLLPEDYNPQQNLYENIADGFILCRMIDTLFKEVQPCDHIKIDPALIRNQRSDSDNLAVYLDYCKKLELKSYFEPDMLFKVKEAFQGVPSLAQDSTNMTRERSLIISNIAQIFELGIKCNSSPRKKEEALVKLLNAKQERDANTPLSSRSRSSSVNSSRGGNLRPTKRNSIALTNFSMAIPSPRMEGLTPKSARFAKDMFDSPTLSGNKTPPTIPYLKPFTASSDCLSQISSPLSNVTTEDDIWLEHMLEDMKITPPPSESKFSFKYYLNRAGSYFSSEEQRDEFMSLLKTFKFLQIDLSGCQKFINEKEICEIISRLCDNRHALRLDLSGYCLKSNINLVEKYLSSKTAIKYLIMKDCGFGEEEKSSLKRVAKNFDILTDL